MENQADITRYITRATNRNAIIGKLAVYALTATQAISAVKQNVVKKG